MFGGFATLFADLCSFVAKDGSQLMIRFRWVRSKPFAPSSQVWLNPAYVVINNNKPVIL